MHTLSASNWAAVSACSFAVAPVLESLEVEGSAAELEQAEERVRWHVLHLVQQQLRTYQQKYQKHMQYPEHAQQGDALGMLLQRLTAVDESGEEGHRARWG